MNDLKEAPKPQNKSEVWSFLGMSQYSARFIHSFATMSEPLRALTRQDTEWQWDDVHDTAFNDIKNALSENVTTVYYDSRKQTEIIVDASPVGIGAILTQEGKPVAYASRSLTDVEQRYSQTEREAVAVVWGCEHLNIYTEGADSTIIVTDHRPLLGIWLKPNPPLRIARWALKLQNYITLQYRCGRENPADYLSRHPVPITTSSTAHRMAADYVNYKPPTRHRRP